jgi:hypothetical protein
MVNAAMVNGVAAWLLPAIFSMIQADFRTSKRPLNMFAIHELTISSVSCARYCNVESTH